MTRRDLLWTPFLAGAVRAAGNSLASNYRDAAARLIGSALADDTGYRRLAYLCDRIGNRVSGSDALKRAIDWSVAEMEKDGLANVRTSPVMSSHWVRGSEDCTLLAPVERKLHMLGLGRSIGTPREGITAEVVAVSSFDELASLGRDRIAGRIVLFNVPFTTYDQTVPYRGAGPSRASALGAVAVLVRAVGSASLRTPHTGGLRYKDDAPRIPAAAVSWEDAMMIQRLIDDGDRVRVRLRMEAQDLPFAASANVIAEVAGRESDEVVVIGGHLDSWDVGQGAHDDGSGCVAAMESGRLIHKLGLKPRRTIRVVLWTDEEASVAGGRAYREMIGKDIDKHVAAIEMDGGAEKPRGFETPVKNPRSLAVMADIASLLEGVGASEMIPGQSEADVSPLAAEGVPVLGVRTTMRHYFDWHHTDADTLDKVEPAYLRANTAAMAVMAYVLADMPGRLDREPPVKA